MASNPSTQPMLQAVQQPCPHLIPDMMVLPSVPVHGQRMMVPAVWDANHRCFVVSVNSRPCMSAGYQFVYPPIQMSPPLFPTQGTQPVETAQPQTTQFGKLTPLTDELRSESNSGSEL